MERLTCVRCHFGSMGAITQPEQQTYARRVAMMPDEPAVMASDWGMEFVARGVSEEACNAMETAAWSLTWCLS